MAADIKRLDVTLGGLHIEDNGVNYFNAGPITWYDLPYEVTLLIQRTFIDLFAQLNALGYSKLAEMQKAVSPETTE
jgi:hypothetical protein